MPRLYVIFKLCLALLFVSLMNPLSAQDNIWPLITFKNFEQIQSLVTISMHQDDESRKYLWERSIEFMSSHEVLIIMEDRIQIWDIIEERLIQTLTPNVGKICESCIAWAGLTRLAIGGDSGLIRFWDLETQRWDEEIIDTDADLWSLAINPSQTTMITAFAHGAAVKIREFPSGRAIHEIWVPGGFSVLELEFLNDTTFVAANPQTGADICKIDDIPEDCVYLYNDKNNEPGDYGIDEVAISPSHKFIAWRKAGIYAELWDWQLEEEVPIFGGEALDRPPHTQYSTMIFSPDEKLLVSAPYLIRSSEGSQLVAWDIQSYNYIEAPYLFKSRGLDIAFNPDGRSIAVLYEDKIELWGIPSEP